LVYSELNKMFQQLKEFLNHISMVSSLEKPADAHHDARLELV